MVVYLLVKVFICVVLIYSTKFLVKKLDIIEIIANYLLIMSTVTLLYNVVNINLELLKIKKAIIIIPIFQLDRLIILPILTLWLFFLYRKLSGRYVLHFLLTILWGLSAVGLRYINKVLDVYQFTSWSFL